MSGKCNSCQSTYKQTVKFKKERVKQLRLSKKLDKINEQINEAINIWRKDYHIIEIVLGKNEFILFDEPRTKFGLPVSIGWFMKGFYITKKRK